MSGHRKTAPSAQDAAARHAKRSNRRAPIDVLNLYPPHEATLAGLVGSRAAVRADNPFILFEDRTLSWLEFGQAVLRAANMLKSQGVARGDRVAAMSPNSDTYVVLFFAVARIGAIFVPVNPDLTASEAGFILKHAEPRMVFCTPATYPAVVATINSMERVPRLVALDGRGGDLPEFGALVAAAPPEPVESAAPEDTCLVLYTSGTTGLPKGVMHSQRSFVTAGEAFVERMYLQPDDRLLCVLPFFHINALIYSLGGATAAGASIIVTRRFSASNFWELAEKSGATEANIIAAVGRILARRPRSEFRSGHRIRKIYGAPISPDIYEVFRNEFAVPVLIEGYGMTEVPGVCNNPFEGPHKIGSMGRPALHPDHSLPFAEMRVIDEDGRDVRDGEVGQLAVRTPVIMQGYFRDPTATRAAFRDGWFLTGDLVYRSPDGFYTFVARQKDVIRRRGENISGAELDNVISQHPEILAAAAIPVPSELGEDDILVAVVKKPDARLSAQNVHEWCARHLNSSKWPRYIAFVDSLPYTPSHRVAKHRLRQDPNLRAKAVEIVTPRAGDSRALQ